jgi:predicted phosphodiesterase
MSIPPPLAFPARLISDLHLGHEVSAVRDIQQLEPLLDGIRTLILNGDTLECRLPRFLPKSQELQEDLFARCAAKGITPIMINGNHDPSHWPYDGLELFGGKVFITHGHSFFKMVSPWSSKLKYCGPALEKIWSEYPAEALEKLETRYELARRCSEAMIATEVRQHGTGAVAKLVMALNELWPPSRPWAVFKVWTTLPFIATRFANQFRPDCEAMFFGHTHRAAWWEKQGRLLANTGGFVSFGNVLCVDFPQDRCLEVRRTNVRNGIYHPGKVLTQRRWD